MLMASMISFLVTNLWETAVATSIGRRGFLLEPAALGPSAGGFAHTESCATRQRITSGKKEVLR